MSKSKLCLAAVLSLLAACSAPKPVAQRDTSAEDLNAVRARAAAADRGLDAETKTPRPTPGH